MNSKEVKEILAKVLEIDIATIFDNATQKDIAKWDSLQHLNLIVEIEDKYDISIDPEDISEMLSIDKIIEIIKKYKHV
jgi:acyl carrier protein